MITLYSYDVSYFHIVLHKFYGTKWPLCADVPLRNHLFIHLSYFHALSQLKHAYTVHLNIIVLEIMMMVMMMLEMVMMVIVMMMLEMMMVMMMMMMMMDMMVVDGPLIRFSCPQLR